MNHLVFLDTHAMELEKILSGVKTMLAKEINPSFAADHAVKPSDDLYFLRNKEECSLRVRATVVRVVLLTQNIDEDLTHSLKEMQPKLQLTEAQFNDWSVKEQVLLVEFASAHKIDEIQLAPEKITNRSEWIPFEAFDSIAE